MLEPGPAILEYRAIYGRRSPEQLRTLAEIKRFSEYLTGDPVFREALAEQDANLGAVMDAYGLPVDAELMRPLFSKRFSQYRFENGDPRWPLAQLWDDFLLDKFRFRDALRALADTGGLNPRYDAWRKRQIRRCASELGTQGDAIVHALVSYELSRGCSVGCWFCGISADRFAGSLPYTPATDLLWRGILETMVGRFGSAAQTGFCYWATDPCDNPDYPAFIQAHYDVTGMLPQTTTAAPLKNVALTRRILAMSERIPCTVNRFSILTVPILKRVFAEFTPLELLGVELVMQQREALGAKSLSGRAFQRAGADRPKAVQQQQSLVPSEPSTIACVSGFLVNMVDRKVRLVSPTRACERWPDGYRVYEEASFETVADFTALIDGMVLRHMPEDLVETDVLRFRPDLGVSSTDNGFVAQTAAYRQTYANDEFGFRLGRMLESGDHTLGDIVRDLAGAGTHLLVIHQELQNLFDRGLLDDDPIHGGINRRETSSMLEFQ
jgi:radical SAM family RiPP maturation amino acid epimerase